MGMDKWMTVEVDHLLPQGDRQIHAISSDSGELWCAYAEKAYAKRYGGYDGIKSGKGVEAMVDLTGGFALYTTLQMAHAEETFEFLYENQHKMIMTSAIFGGGENETELDTGLFDQHEYSLMRLEMVRNNDGQIVRLVRIRNPWGTNQEFRGDWSDDSKIWGTIPTEKKMNFTRKKMMGLFGFHMKTGLQTLTNMDFVYYRTKRTRDLLSRTSYGRNIML